MPTSADTGLVYMRHRWYDPTIRQFINEDPAQAGMNWYQYAGNDPVNAWDPMGLDYIHVDEESDDVFWVSAGKISTWWNKNNSGAGDRMAKVGKRYYENGYWYVKLANGGKTSLSNLKNHTIHAANSDELGNDEFIGFVSRQINSVNSPYNNTQQYAAGLFDTANTYAVPVAKAVATLPVLYLGGVAFGDKLVAGGKAIAAGVETATTSASATVITTATNSTLAAKAATIYTGASIGLEGLAWIADPEGQALSAAAGNPLSPADDVQDLVSIGKGLKRLVAKGRTVFSGHGALLKERFLQVPEGTAVTVWGNRGAELEDALANHVELGIMIPTDRIDSIKGARTFLPGFIMPDYTLFPPNMPNSAPINIMGNPLTVNSPTNLSELLQPNQRNVNWAACLKDLTGK